MEREGSTIKVYGNQLEKNGARNWKRNCTLAMVGYEPNKEIIQVYVIVGNVLFIYHNAMKTMLVSCKLRGVGWSACVEMAGKDSPCPKGSMTVWAGHDSSEW